MQQGVHYCQGNATLTATLFCEGPLPLSRPTSAPGALRCSPPSKLPFNMYEMHSRTASVGLTLIILLLRSNLLICISVLSVQSPFPVSSATTDTLSSTSHRPPTSRSPMDLGLEVPQAEHETAKKKQAVGGTSSELNKHVLTLSKLVMSNSMNVRHLQGAVFDTWRLPASSDFTAGIREATRLHTEAMKKQGNNEAAANKLGPPHIHAWNAIVSTLAKKELADD